MKIVSITLVALATLASSSVAFAGSSPFCFGGAPTPKYVCDAIKADQKPQHAVAGQDFTVKNSGPAVRLNSGRISRR